MASTVVIFFMTVACQDITLPINDWSKDVGDLFQQAYDSLPDSGLIHTGGRRGIPLYALIEIRNFYKLKGLSFLGQDCTALQGLELVTAIQTLTIIIDKLLSNNETIKSIIADFLGITQEIDYQQRMSESFAESTIGDEYDWESEPEYALFSLIKALIFVMSEALVKNEFFLYLEVVA